MNIEEINKQYLDFYGKNGLSKNAGEKIERYKNQIRKLEARIRLNEALYIDDESRAAYGNKTDAEIDADIRLAMQEIETIKADLEEEKVKFEKAKLEVDAALEELKKDPKMEHYINEILAKRYDRKLKTEEDIYKDKIKALKEEKKNTVEKLEKEKDGKETVKNNIELLKSVIVDNKSLQLVVEDALNAEKEKQEKILELNELDPNDKDYLLKVEDMKKQIKDIDKNNKNKKKTIVEEVKAVDDKFTIDDLNSALKTLINFKTEKYEITDKDGNKIQKERDIDILSASDKASKSFEKELKYCNKKIKDAESNIDTQIETEKEAFSKKAKLYSIAMEKLGVALENPKSRTGEYVSELVEEGIQEKIETEVEYAREVAKGKIIDEENARRATLPIPEQPKWWQVGKRIKNWFNRKKDPDRVPTEVALKDKIEAAEEKAEKDVRDKYEQQRLNYSKEPNKFINSIKYEVVNDLIVDKDRSILDEAEKELEEKKDEPEVGE